MIFAMSSQKTFLNVVMVSGIAIGARSLEFDYRARHSDMMSPTARRHCNIFSEFKAVLPRREAAKIDLAACYTL